MKRLHFILFWITVTAMEKSQQDCVLCAPKPAGRPRASDLEARHQNLIDTAGQLFLKHGYSKVSLEMIAREAHVAVRTIYVKFGGKAGLFTHVIEANRVKFYALDTMEADTRPLREIVRDFAVHFYDMIIAPEALRIMRMVIAEAATNPEVSQAFFDAGPRQTREMLARFFARPDIRSQLHPDVDSALLPVHLLNCVMGDQYSRYLFDPPQRSREEVLAALDKRLNMFYLGALAH
jgi:TetR/AcrR family transcriptional repressor of mexJK operon